MGCLSGTATEITLHRQIKDRIYSSPGPWQTQHGGRLSIEWYHARAKSRVVWRVWWIPSRAAPGAEHRLLAASQPRQFADDATVDLWRRVRMADAGVFQARADVCDPDLYLPLLAERDN